MLIPLHIFYKPKYRGYLLVRLVISTRGNVIAGLDEGIRQMTLGETALLKIRFDFAYSSYSMGANIPPRSNMIFKVALLAVNEKNGRGMPYRQLKRFSRMVWRKSTFCVRLAYRALMRIVKTKTFAYLMKRLFNIDIALDEERAEESSSVSSEEQQVEEVL